MKKIYIAIWEVAGRFLVSNTSTVEDSDVALGMIQSEFLEPWEVGQLLGGN